MRWPLLDEDLSGESPLIFIEAQRRDQAALAAAIRFAALVRFNCLGFIRVFPLVPRLILPRFERLSPRPISVHLLHLR